MKPFLKKLFLNERFVLCIIVINAFIIFLQESGYYNFWVNLFDVTCTIIFIIEMIVKHAYYGIRGYWSKGWNRLDGILVILSIPSLIMAFVPIHMINLSFLLALRLFRVLRFFRIIHIFPNFSQIAKGFMRALKQSYGVFIGFFLVIIIFSLVSCSLFKTASPEFFGSPTESIYSIFRLFTIEGWYEIPDAVIAGLPDGFSRWVRIYFSILLVLGGVIGLSLVNSVFVDAMVSDNNDEVKEKLDEIERKLNMLVEEKREEKD